MSTRAPESQLWELMRGPLTSRALAIAADLGVAKALADGPRPVEELAQEVGADPDTLHRILRALATEGVFAEDEPGVFRNTEASDQLLESGWGAFAHLFVGAFYHALRIPPAILPLLEPPYVFSPVTPGTPLPLDRLGTYYPPAHVRIQSR